MDRDTLLALAERCEKADGPDRDLDTEIAVAVSGDAGAWVVGPQVGSIFSHKAGWWRDSTDHSHLAPAYTGSLDAATSLFGSQTLYRSGHDGEGPDPADYFCQAMTPAPGCHVVRVVARTEALARTAAALGALAYATQEPTPC